MHFLIELFFNIKYFVGFITNNAFPPKLTETEEQQLLEALFNEEEHEEARRKLIEHNLRLVAHIAKKYETEEQKDQVIFDKENLKDIKVIADNYVTVENNGETTHSYLNSVKPKDGEKYAFVSYNDVVLLTK